MQLKMIKKYYSLDVITFIFLHVRKFTIIILGICIALKDLIFTSVYD